MNGKRIDLKQATMREIMAFSLLPFGMMFINSSVYTALNLYMTDILGFSMLYVSLITLGTKAWDAVNDPVMGMIVERTRTKWGKCRPYLLWISPVLCISTMILYYPVPFGDRFNGPNGNRALFAVLLIAYMIHIAAYTAIDIPYNSMTPLVFPERKSRVKAVSISSVVGSLGTILPSVLIFTLADAFGNGRNDPSNKGYFWAVTIFAILGSAFITASFFGIREKIYIPPVQTQYRKGLRIVFSDRRMIILVLCAFFTGMINVGAMFLPYFAKWNTIGTIPMESINNALNSIKMFKNVSLSTTGLMTPLLQIGSGLSYMVSMLLIPPLLKRMSKKKLWIRMSLLGALAQISTYIIGIYIVPYTTPAGLILFTAMRFLTNFPVGASTVLLISMLADLTDEIELVSNERLEATIFSFKSFVMKLAMASINAVALLIMQTVGYKAETMDILTRKGSVPLIESPVLPSIYNGINYTNVLNTIFFLLTAFCAVGLILQAIPMFYYKESDPEVMEQLAEYRSEREAKRQEALDKALAEAQNNK